MCFKMTAERHKQQLPEQTDLEVGGGAGNQIRRIPGSHHSTSSSYCQIETEGQR